jgi:hypothetical protein
VLDSCRDGHRSNPSRVNIFYCLLLKMCYRLLLVLLVLLVSFLDELIASVQILSTLNNLIVSLCRHVFNC